MFFSQYFFWSYQSKLPWAKEFTISTIMNSRTGLIHIQALISSYHQVCILLYKLNTKVLLMPLWVRMMYHRM